MVDLRQDPKCCIASSGCLQVSDALFAPFAVLPSILHSRHLTLRPREAVHPANRQARIRSSLRAPPEIIRRSQHES